MPFASIFPGLHTLNLIIFSKLKIGGFEKVTFFEISNLQFSILNSYSYFLSFHPHENQPQIVGWHGWDSINMITMVSSKFLGVPINLLHCGLPFTV